LRQRGEWKNSVSVRPGRHKGLEESTDFSELGNIPEAKVVLKKRAHSVVSMGAVSFFLDWPWEVAYYL
jgi:hypothetical protein